MHHLSLSGKVNRDQHFGKNDEYKAFYTSKDTDSVLDGSVSSNTSSPPGIRANENSAADKSIVDLDLIVEKFIQYMWEKTKSKSEKKYEFEDLDIHVNWAKVDFTQEEAKFEPKKSGIKEPMNQTLFKTKFTNKTDGVQEYSFKTERTTRQSCCFSFSKGFSREKEAAVGFKIPGDIVEIGGGIRSEQSVECGKDKTNEEEVKWGCDSMIKVAPHSQTSASLVITELQMERAFCVTTYLKGRLVITLNHKKDGFVKSFSADIAQIIDIGLDKLWIPRNSTKFEVISMNGERTVKSYLYGSCKFRLGVEQHIEINEHKLI